MKSLNISIVFLAVILPKMAFAQLPAKLTESSEMYIKTENNYLAGLESGVPGLKVSAAYFLGEMKSEKALFPLMKMFREANNYGARLVAAWALLKIGDKRGVFLVKRYIQLGNCDDIRCMLQQMYLDYSLKTYGKLVYN